MNKILSCESNYMTIDQFTRPLDSHRIDILQDINFELYQKILSIKSDEEISPLVKELFAICQEYQYVIINTLPLVFQAAFNQYVAIDWYRYAEPKFTILYWLNDKWINV